MCTCDIRTHLVIVVVGQTAAIKSHPPPLKHTVPAKRGEKVEPHKFWAKSTQTFKTAQQEAKLQVLAFH